MTKRIPRLVGVVPAGLIAGYFALSAVRAVGWFSSAWSPIPVIETAWLNLLIVFAALLWMRARKVPLQAAGLDRFAPSRSLARLLAGTMLVDTLAVGAATPLLVQAFGEAPAADRFAPVVGNLGLLVVLLPLTWLIGAFGEEFFFRGFLMTWIAETLGSTRSAWVLAVVIQAAAFGLIHAYQGPAKAISIGLGGAVYGVAYLIAGRSLWPVILAHGINDTLGFVLLYLGAISG